MNILTVPFLVLTTVALSIYPIFYTVFNISDSNSPTDPPDVVPATKTVPAIISDKNPVDIVPPIPVPKYCPCPSAVPATDSKPSISVVSDTDNFFSESTEFIPSKQTSTVAFEETSAITSEETSTVTSEETSTITNETSTVQESSTLYEPEITSDSAPVLKIPAKIESQSVSLNFTQSLPTTTAKIEPVPTTNPPSTPKTTNPPVPTPSSQKSEQCPNYPPQTVPIDNSNYCHLPTCRGKPHSLCAYNSSVPSQVCGVCRTIGLTPTEKQSILALHNELRQKVARGEELRGRPGPQPAAVPGSMCMMRWDDGLEHIAQRYANQCKKTKKQCLDTPQMKININGYYAHTKKKSRADRNPVDMARVWYEQVAKIDRGIIERYRTERKSGIYTQFVWGQSSLLGCGFLKCKSGPRYGIYLVCAYGPRGNTIGRVAYPSV